MTHSTFPVRALFGGLALFLFPQACGEPPCEETRSCAASDADASLGGARGDGDGDDPLGDGDGDSDPGGSPGTSDCEDGELLCDGACVDPASDSSFCGAVKDCAGKNAGESCSAQQTCEDAVCVARCEVGELYCDGSCIDPLSNELYCGAANECLGRPDSGRQCEEEEMCVLGTCRAWDAPVKLPGQVTSAVDSYSVAFSSAGHTMVASARGGQPYASRFDPVSSWLPEVQLWDNVLSVTMVGVTSNSEGQAAHVRRTSQDPGYNVGIRSINVATGAFEESTKLSDNTETAGTPSAAVDEAGNIFAVWEQQDSLFMSTALPDPSESHFELSVPVEDAPGVVNAPKVFATGIGAAMAVWRQEGANYAASLSLTGPASEPVKLSADGAVSVGTPYVQSSGRGELAVTWDQPVGDSREVVVLTYSEGGWSERTTFAAQFATPQISFADIDEEGSVFVVWFEDGETSDRIYASRKDHATGEWSEPVSLANDTSDSLPSHPRLAVDGAGHAIVLFQQFDGQKESLWVNRYDIAEGAWGGATLLETDHLYDVTDPLIAALPDGTAMAFWIQKGPSDAIWSAHFH